MPRAHAAHPGAQRDPGRILRAVVVLAMICAVGGCSAPGARRTERKPSPATPKEAAPALTAEPMGPLTPQASEPVASSQDPTPAAEAPPAATPTPRTPTNVAQHTPNGGREDGRPNWWFADIRRSDGSVQLCAEALGADMVTARDGALQAARARMRSQLALDGADAIPGERIERAWVWPLPNSRVGPSRYAGYVLIAASGAGAD